MENTTPEQGIEDLALMLMYLCRMKENVPGLDKPVWYAWKGYEWETMEELEKNGMIGQSRKMVTFTDDGIEKARELLAKYGISDWPPIPAENDEK